MTGDHKVGAVAIVALTVIVLLAMVLISARSSTGGQEALRHDQLRTERQMAYIAGCKAAPNPDACLARVNVEAGTQ